MKTDTREFNVKRISSSIGLVLLLTGCTTLYEGKYDFREGWREARVSQIAAASQIQRPDFLECIRKATPQQRDGKPFVVLSYKRFGRTAKRAVPQPSTSQVRIGDSVYVNLSSCEGPIVQRTSHRQTDLPSLTESRLPVLAVQPVEGASRRDQAALVRA